MPIERIHKYWVLPSLPSSLLTWPQRRQLLSQDLKLLTPLRYYIQLGQGPQQFSGIIVPT